MEDALAAAAASSLVTVLATQAVTTAMAKASRVLSRWKPEPEVTAQLERTHAVVEAAPAAREVETSWWVGEFDALLTKHPDARSEVQTLVEDLKQLLLALPLNTGIQQTGSVGRDNIQIQGAGEVTIGRDPAGRGRLWRR